MWFKPDSTANETLLRFARGWGDKSGRLGVGVQKSIEALLRFQLGRRLVLWLHWLSVRPWVGTVQFGDLRKLAPISRYFGFDRGLPVDRYYVERFLSAHAKDIRGNVLEIGDDRYTRKFGGDRVSRSDVLHAVEGNPQATIVADLARADNLQSNTFDCIILTQTLQYIYDVHAAVRTLHRILRPEGVLLATLPGISQTSWRDMDRWGEYWRFTNLSTRRLFEEVFSKNHVEVEPFGNVLAAIAFLHGIAAEELRPEELEHRDPDYEVTLAVRARKVGASSVEGGSLERGRIAPMTGNKE